jgi:HAD superfamily hydrolase (TIGR01509 family)
MPPALPFKAIFFDLGGVCVSVDTSTAIKELAFMSRKTEDEVHQAIFGSGLIDRFERGEISGQQFHRLVRHKLAIHPTYAKFKTLWSSIPGPSFGMDDILARLKLDWKLFAVSNTNEIHFPFIALTNPIVRHFSAFFLSYELGHLKPEPEFFVKAIDRSGFAPHEILYIDDRPDFVAAGRKLGLNGLVFTGAWPLQEWFMDRGVKFSAGLSRRRRSSTR